MAQKNPIQQTKMKIYIATILAIAALSSATPVRAADESKPAYPLTKCLVSGEKLGGDMGKPFVFTYEGREIELCCKSCKKEFDKDPAKYMKAYDAAVKAAR
jgi:YHS domain-containing protein